MKKFILCCFFSLLWSFDVWATPQFEADVSVDVTASNVAEAKKQAMLKAIRDGLNNVVLSISTQASVDELNKLNDNQIQHFISEVMVLMEKSSDVRYIADLRVSVNEDVLKSYLNENDLPLVVGEEQDVLVVPLLENEDGSLDLWGAENSWREVFLNRKNLKKGNLNLITIQKNLGNISIVEANRIFEMSEKEYNEMASFNNVEDIYVLKYSIKDGKVYVKSFPKGEISEVMIEDTPMVEVINKVLPFFKDTKKVSNNVENSVVVEDVLEIVYNYPKLGKWMELRQLLESIPQVQDIKVISLAKRKVHFSFKYIGIIEKLQTALSLRGYNLNKEGDFYAIN